MNLLSRKTQLALALAATLVAPLAFAQQTDAAAQQAQQSTMQDPAQPAPEAGAPGKKSWADVDGDKDGKLTKTEAAAVPALAQVFDQADSDADGSLTSEEYKSFVGKSQGDQGAETKK